MDALLLMGSPGHGPVSVARERDGRTSADGLIETGYVAEKPGPVLGRVQLAPRQVLNYVDDGIGRGGGGDGGGAREPTKQPRARAYGFGPIKSES